VDYGFWKVGVGMKWLGRVGGGDEKSSRGLEQVRRAGATRVPSFTLDGKGKEKLYTRREQ
jgi:hypothetical protein